MWNETVCNFEQLTLNFIAFTSCLQRYAGGLYWEMCFCLGVLSYVCSSIVTLLGGVREQAGAADGGGEVVRRVVL